MTDTILVINSGSSSIKFALYPAGSDGDQPLIKGKIAGIGQAPDFVAFDGEGKELAEGHLENLGGDAGHGELVQGLLDWVDSEYGSLKVVAAGHRVVHGGQVFDGPVKITSETFKQMDELTPLAPLHQPHNLAAVTAISKRSPDILQVACFDTSFHRTQPRLAQLFGLPHELSDAGIIRYGFHGLSYDYIASVLGELPGCKADGRVIVAHLGNGASICAMNNRQSVATSMGFTALHGLIMGRRSGTLDAGAVLHLIQQRGMSVDEVHQLLYRESGLLGVSGFSNNMRELQESSDPRAAEAVDLFCYRAACEFGSHATAMEGLDAIVFTAGIGENSAVVRKKICQQLGWLGIEIDAAENDDHRVTISTQSSKISVHVVATNEELVIARATQYQLEP
ncbi:Acetate kinase [hydrothermal vent metagenome]|uniref:Acetate kinase n=1 Tax=hydrothermal vent metagenome TaxID=652676 RepID=A0A3B0SND8_9ZZZZ